MNTLRLSLIFSLVLTFSSNAFGHGAGVIPVFDDGTVLLGKEIRTYKQGPLRGQRHAVISDFGGRQDAGETYAQTAYREFIEETAHYTFGVGSPYNIQLAHVQQAEANGHYADHHHAATGKTYRSYFVRVHGQKPDIRTIIRNAAVARHRLGHRAHVEKVEWQYFDPQALRAAPFQNGFLFGANAPLHGPFNAVLRQASAQNYLQNVVPLPAPANVHKAKPGRTKAARTKTVRTKAVRAKKVRTKAVRAKKTRVKAVRTKKARVKAVRTKHHRTKVVRSKRVRAHKVNHGRKRGRR